MYGTCAEFPHSGNQDGGAEGNSACLCENRKTNDSGSDRSSINSQNGRIPSDVAAHFPLLAASKEAPLPLSPSCCTIATTTATILPEATDVSTSCLVCEFPESKFEAEKGDVFPTALPQSFVNTLLKAAEHPSNRKEWRNKSRFEDSSTGPDAVPLDPPVLSSSSSKKKRSLSAASGDKDIPTNRGSSIDLEATNDFEGCWTVSYYRGHNYRRRRFRFTNNDEKWSQLRAARRFRLLNDRRNAPSDQEGNHLSFGSDGGFELNDEYRNTPELTPWEYDYCSPGPPQNVSFGMQPCSVPGPLLMPDIGDASISTLMSNDAWGPQAGMPLEAQNCIPIDPNFPLVTPGVPYGWTFWPPSFATEPCQDPQICCPNMASEFSPPGPLINVPGLLQPVQGNLPNHAAPPFLYNDISRYCVPQVMCTPGHGPLSHSLPSVEKRRLSKTVSAEARRLRVENLVRTDAVFGPDQKKDSQSLCKETISRRSVETIPSYDTLSFQRAPAYCAEPITTSSQSRLCCLDSKVEMASVVDRSSTRVLHDVTMAYDVNLLPSHVMPPSGPGTFDADAPPDIAQSSGSTGGLPIKELLNSPNTRSNSELTALSREELHSLGLEWPSQTGIQCLATITTNLTRSDSEDPGNRSEPILTDYDHLPNPCLGLPDYLKTALRKPPSLRGIVTTTGSSGGWYNTAPVPHEKETTAF